VCSAVFDREAQGQKASGTGVDCSTCPATSDRELNVLMHLHPRVASVVELNVCMNLYSIVRVLQLWSYCLVFSGACMLVVRVHASHQSGHATGCGCACALCHRAVAHGRIGGVD